MPSGYLPRIFLPVLLVAIAAGCGACGSDSSTPTPAVTIIGPGHPLAPSDSFLFAASVDAVPGAPVVWGVLEGGIGGAISADGHYVAPGTPGIYHVVATSVATPHGADTVAVSVIADPTPAFTSFPDSIEAFTSAQVLPFTVTGAVGDSNTWTVTGGSFSGGTPTATGGSVKGSDSLATYLVVTLHTTNGAGRSATIKDSVKVLGSRLILPDQTYALAISSTNVIASMEWLNENVRFRDATDRGILRNVPIASTPIHGVFSLDGASFYVDLQSSNQVSKITVSSGVSSTVSIGHPPFNIALADSGASIFVTTADGWLFKMDAGTLAKQDSLYINAGSNGLAARAGQLWVGTLTGMVYKVDPVSLALLDSVSVGGEAQRVALNSDASKLYLANQGTNNYQVITTATKSVSTTSTAGYGGGTPVGAALTPDGTEVWFGARNQGRVDRFNAATMSYLGSITIGGSVRDITFSNDGHIVVVGAEGFSMLIRR